MNAKEIFNYSPKKPFAFFETCSSFSLMSDSVVTHVPCVQSKYYMPKERKFLFEQSSFCRV